MIPPPVQEDVLGVAEVVPQVVPTGQAQAGGLVQGTAAPDGSRQLEHFLKLHPPFFKGIMDLRVAEEWIASVKKLFDVMQAPDQLRMILVPFVLQGSMDHWWSLVTHMKDVGDMTWA